MTSHFFVSSPCELVFTLDVHSLHSVAIGLTILCSQCWILVNSNAAMVAFIEIGGTCLCLFYMLTNTTLNRHDF